MDIIIHAHVSMRTIILLFYTLSFQKFVQNFEKIALLKMEQRLSSDPRILEIREPSFDYSLGTDGHGHSTWCVAADSVCLTLIHGTMN